MKFERNWCEVPHVKGDGTCLRHTNYQVTVSGARWHDVFPHDNDVTGDETFAIGAYVCGHHLRKLVDSGLHSQFITHLDGPGGLIRF